MSSSASRHDVPLSAAISAQRETARAELAAEWARLASRVLDKTFEAVAAGVEDELREAYGRARRETSEAFNRAARRLGGFESEFQWGSALLDAAADFGFRGGVFAVSGAALVPLNPAGGDRIPLESAPAIRAAIEARETTAAVVSVSEFSAPVAALFGDSARAAVLPLSARGRVAYVLAASGEPLDMNALEALGALATAALESRQRSPEPETGEQPPLAGEQLEGHLRARRFARVRAAEMRLYHSDAVLKGRADGGIYAELKQEIDSARGTFEREHLSRCSGMPDYLHLELVRVLANDDASLLGKDYPGPLA